MTSSSESHPPHIKFKDAAQLIVGSCVLGIPLAYSEETWKLEEQLPIVIILMIAMLSLCFLAFFNYFMFFEGSARNRLGQFLVRLVLGYGITLVTIGLILKIIQKCLWLSDPVLAFKRTIVVAFPACFSATLIDSLR
jgi:uncharacterized membrane protein